MVFTSWDADGSHRVAPIDRPPDIEHKAAELNVLGYCFHVLRHRKEVYVTSPTGEKIAFSVYHQSIEAPMHVDKIVERAHAQLGEKS